MRIVAAMFILAAIVAACSSAPPAPVSTHAKVTVQPGTSVEDQAVQIRVAGLTAGALATVRITSTDVYGDNWSASARYRADASGAIDLSRQAPVSGSYQGVSGMGLIWSMQSADTAALSHYYWDTDSADGIPPSFLFTVTVTASGKTVASTTFQRALSGTSLLIQPETLKAKGFMGEFDTPAASAGRHPAVLVLGGSEGGLPDPVILSLLASQGYPTLGVAYFKEPGLPSTLSRIPLEYFAKALRWLAAQPGVNPAKIAVLGVSRGSEAAQLVGAYYPSLVHAVIASVPSNVALCSYPGCLGPAWTLDGRALPTTHQVDNPAPTDVPGAVIPDQRIDGPVFLDCGEADQTWTSCPYARAIMSLLNAHHDPWPHVLYAYPGAGHSVGTFDPYEPLGQSIVSAAASSYDIDQEALPALWQHLLSFLASFAASSKSQS